MFDKLKIKLIILDILKKQVLIFYLAHALGVPWYALACGLGLNAL